MQLKSVYLPNSLPEKRLLTWVLNIIVLFLLPHPVLGQTTITVDTNLSMDHMGNIIIGADYITLNCHGFSVIGPGTPINVGTDLLILSD